MKRRTGEPWMPAREYGRSLTGLTVNLLVRDIDKALVFQREVLGVAVVYSDPDFAVVRGYGAEWMLHADHTYTRQPWGLRLGEGGKRGFGVEIRLLGIDPDEAERRARAGGHTVLASAKDWPPHGWRDCVLEDPDGYTFAVGVAIRT